MVWSCQACQASNWPGHNDCGKCGQARPAQKPSTARWGRKKAESSAQQEPGAWSRSPSRRRGKGKNKGEDPLRQPGRARSQSRTDKGTAPADPLLSSHQLGIMALTMPAEDCVDKKALIGFLNAKKRYFDFWQASSDPAATRMKEQLEGEIQRIKQLLYDLQAPPQRAKELRAVIERDHKRIAVTKEEMVTLRSTLRKQEAELETHQLSLQQLVQKHPDAEKELETPVEDPAGVDRRVLKDFLKRSDTTDASVLKEYLRHHCGLDGGSQDSAMVDTPTTPAHHAASRIHMETPLSGGGGFAQLAQAQAHGDLRQNLQAAVMTDPYVLLPMTLPSRASRAPFGSRPSRFSPYTDVEPKAHSAEPAQQRG